jgi:glutamyl-tRNA reductase
VPKIQALNEQAAAWQEIEIERVKKHFFKTADVSQANLDAALQALAKNISNKFLHLAYKEIAESTQGTNE